MPDPKVISTIQRYCAYQERSHRQVRQKLQSLGISRPAIDNVLADLITDRFVDEERYARAYARGKFRNNGWGRVKIDHRLQMEGVSAANRLIAFNEIDEEAYFATLVKLIGKKAKELLPKEIDVRLKLCRYGAQKGFEHELINRAVEQVLKS